MEKVLILTSVASMVDQFMIPNIQQLINMGWKVDVACNFEEGNTCSTERISSLKKKLHELGVTLYQIDFSREIINIKKHVRAYRQTQMIFRKNNYKFVHCHSPIGGVIGRLIGKKNNVKVIYTAHGFHFYKGAPKKNWILYYPVEKYLSRYTDVLITINTEDYEFAKRKMKAEKVVYVPGIGIELAKFKTGQADALKRINYCTELKIPFDARIIFSVGELNKNKNHEAVIRAIEGLDVYYIIAGQGAEEQRLRKIASDIGMEERVKFLGFRDDVEDLLKIVDIFVFPSFREGLSVSLMEAMAAGLPCVVSNIRGNVDLIDKYGGRLFEPHSIRQCRESICDVIENNMDTLGVYNQTKIQRFGLEVVLDISREIYSALA